ncbi:MAG: hypothetical protein JSV22_12655 [Bacteroidales bacterium]|nr:MAG: hypothetical protein JSV22_12655 [Bacteroidales bacterium]
MKRYFKLIIVLFIAIVLFGCESQNNQDNGKDKSPLGEWQIIEFTGSIRNLREQGIPLLCEPFDETYYPVLDNEQTYIQFIERTSEPDLEEIPAFVISSYNDSVEGGVFIFYITFDNGYYSNHVLSDFGMQYKYDSIFSSAYTFAGGKWEDDYLAGFIETGTSGGGYSIFNMAGILTSDSRIEGQWYWVEYTAWPAANAPECNSQGKGKGTWVAVKK